jgi:hypothetical protein
VDGTTVEGELRCAGLILGRRRFLRTVGVLAGAGLVPTGCGSAPASLAQPPSAVLHALSPRTYAVFTAAAMRMVGPLGARRSSPRARSTSACSPTRGSSARRCSRGPLAQALLVLEFGVWPLTSKVRARSPRSTRRRRTPS